MVKIEGVVVVVVGGKASVVGTGLYSYETVEEDEESVEGDATRKDGQLRGNGMGKNVGEWREEWREGEEEVKGKKKRKKK